MAPQIIDRMKTTKKLKEASSFLEDRELHRLPVVYGTDDYFLTPDAMWLGFHVPHKDSGFLSTRKRQDYFDSANTFFGSTFPAEEENAGHILIVNHTQTAEEWEKQLIRKEKKLAEEEDRELPDSFSSYVSLARKAIDTREFFRRDIFMFVKTNERSSWQGGFMGFIETLGRLLTSGFGIDESQPLGEEKKENEERAAQVSDNFKKSWLQATPIHRSRVEWLVRYIDSLGSPTPDPAPVDETEWGIGRWQSVMSSWNRRVNLGKDSESNVIRGLEFITTKGEGLSYACMMPVTVTPNAISPLSNWIFSASTLPFPVDVSLHFETLDPHRAEGELNKPIDDAKAQAAEETEADREIDETTQEQRGQLENVKKATIRERKPIMNWQCTFVVYDTDKDELKKKTRELRSHFEGHQIELEAPPRDQRALFYQLFPGADLIVKDWIQRTNTEFLAAGMPWLETSVGASIDKNPALYQGYTVVADGRELKHGSPMFFDLVSIADETDRAPTEFVCGDPGSGKTVSRGLKPVHENALKGITQFIWDPKGDFKPIKENARELLIEPEKVKMIDLGSRGAEHTISLDAFAIAEYDEESEIDDRANSGADLLKSLIAGDMQKHAFMGEVIEDAVGIVVKNADKNEEQPKMLQVETVLADWRQGDFNKPEYRQLQNRSEDRLRDYRDLSYTIMQKIESVKQSSLGRLLFLDPDKGSLKTDVGTTTIFNALNLKEVDPDIDPSQEHLEVTVSRVIQEMMTSFIRSLVSSLDDTVTKATVFDEWHVIRRSRAAERMLDWLKRMGRSKRTSISYLSQSAHDSGGGVLNSVWCGKCETEDNARASCDILQIEQNDYNIKTLMNLTKGEFLYRDSFSRVARVAVDFWDSDILDLFNTNAAEKARQAFEKSKAEAGDDETPDFDLTQFDLTAEEEMELEQEGIT